MGPKMLHVSLFVALALVIASSMASVAAAQSQPEFKLGFKKLADQIPNVVGRPIEDEHYGTNGDSLQRTTTGLMAWRKADNWTAFTNGSTTWINGPQGIQSRPNSERFPWEADAPRGNVQDFSDFAGDWWHHGIYLRINAAGLVDATWRTYQWCATAGSAVACDAVEGNTIRNGGKGRATLNKIDGAIAHGVVTFANSNNWFKQGASISFAVLPYGLLRMETPGKDPVILCSDRFLKEAPEDVRQSSPCGA